MPKPNSTQLKPARISHPTQSRCKSIVNPDNLKLKTQSITFQFDPRDAAPCIPFQCELRLCLSEETSTSSHTHARRNQVEANSMRRIVTTTPWCNDTATLHHDNTNAYAKLRPSARPNNSNRRQKAAVNSESISYTASHAR